MIRRGDRRNLELWLEFSHLVVVRGRWKVSYNSSRLWQRRGFPSNRIILTWLCKRTFWPGREKKVPCDSLNSKKSPRYWINSILPEARDIGMIMVPSFFHALFLPRFFFRSLLFLYHVHTRKAFRHVRKRDFSFAIAQVFIFDRNKNKLDSKDKFSLISNKIQTFCFFY